MVRQDILTGLRNALERGHSLQQAQRILFNSGYSAKDINEATKYLAGSIGISELKKYIHPSQSNIPTTNQSNIPVTGQINQNIMPNTQNIPVKKIEPPQQIQQLSQYSVQEQIPIHNEHSSSGFWVLFSILFLLLLSLIGLLVTLIIQKDKVIAILQSFLS
ncbi:MAG: hypothetical protein QXI33_01110 [Candidatus Pacearchaeota archaeon]